MMTKALIILVLFLSCNVLIQHTNSSRILRESILDYGKVNDNSNYEINKWIEEKSKMFLQVLSRRSPSPRSGASHTCNIPVC